MPLKSRKFMANLSSNIALSGKRRNSQTVPDRDFQQQKQGYEIGSEQPKSL